MGALTIKVPSLKDTKHLDRALTVQLHALALACGNWPVLPLGPDKRPLFDLTEGKGLTVATTDVHTVRDWFGNRAGANIGVAIPPGVIVVDLDPRNAGRTAAEMLKGLADRCGALPATVTAASGGGGVHLWFELPEGMETFDRDPALAGQGIDVLGHGAYVVCPPSSHASGNAYRWVHTGELATLPLTALQALERPRGAPEVPEALLSATTRSWGGLVTSYERMAQEGNRNVLLSRAAWRFANEHQPDEAFRALASAAVRAGLPEREVDSTIRSARAGYSRKGSRQWA